MPSHASPYPVPGGAPGGMPGLVPFTETSSRRDVRLKTPELIESERNIAEAQESKVRAAQQEIDAKARIEEIEAFAEQKRQQEVAEAAQLRAAQEQRNAENLNKWQAEESKKITESEKAGKITSYWEDKSTPARILSAVLVGMGEGAWMGQGGPSPAMQIYRQQVEEDRAIKLSRAEQAEKAVLRATGNVAAARERGQQELQRMSREEIARIQGVKDGHDLSIKRIPRARAQGEALKAELDLEAATKRQEHGIKFAPEVGTTTRVVSGERPGAAPPKDLTVTGFEGQQLTAKSPEEAVKLREQAAALEDARAITTRLKNLSEQKGRLPSPEIQGEIDAELQNLAEKKVVVRGAMTKEDIERDKETFSTGILRGPSAAARALDANIAGMEGTLRSGLKSKTTAIPGAQAPPSVMPIIEPKTMRKFTPKERALLGTLAVSSDPRAAQASAALEADTKRGKSDTKRGK